MVLLMRKLAYPATVSMVAIMLAGCGTTSVAPSRSSEGADPVEEAVGVQELRRELAELRDNVEVQRNELKKLRERQRQLYDDLDYRLRQKEQGSSTTSMQQTGSQDQASVSQQGQADGQLGVSGEQQQDGARQSRPETGQGTQTAARRQGEQQEGRQARSVPRQQAVVASSEEQAAYDDAFELLKQSRYNDAIIDFRSMIEEFPDGALVDDAQYWIGEAYYVTRDFQNSREAFNAVVNRYPDSQRVPEAMLKLGYVQAELGELEQARQTLNEVISRYPGSRVAISAETRLNKIR